MYKPHGSVCCGCEVVRTCTCALCCFALFVCLTLLASFFLPSHLSFKNMYLCSTGVVWRREVPTTRAGSSRSHAHRRPPQTSRSRGTGTCIHTCTCTCIYHTISAVILHIHVCTQCIHCMCFPSQELLNHYVKVQGQVISQVSLTHLGYLTYSIQHSTHLLLNRPFSTDVHVYKAGKSVYQLESYHTVLCNYRDMTHTLC